MAVNYDSQSLNQFLKSITRDELLSGVDKEQFQYQIVIGNEASDMDSIISSIAFSFFLSKQTNNEAIKSFPLINIPKEDFALRTETFWIFKQMEIDFNNLIFMDSDVDNALLALQQKDLLRVVLVDHNRLAVHQETYLPSVVEIIDHHKDEKQSKTKLQDIRLVGSCSTLVAERILENNKNIIIENKALGRLLFGTILLDTINLDPKMEKVTPTDEKVAAQLQTLLGYSDDEKNALFKQLSEERFNVSNLGTIDLLRSDYKQWKMGAVELGVSSAKRSFKEWFQSDSELFAENCDKFIKQYKLNILYIMTFYIDKNDRRREIGIVTYNKELYDKSVSFLMKSNLNLQPIFTNEATNYSNKGRIVGFFNQENIAASRKQLQPLLAELFEK